VGAIVATLLPLPIVVLDPDVGLTRGLVVLAVLLAVHAVNGNIGPKLLGDLNVLHTAVEIYTLL